MDKFYGTATLANESSNARTPDLIAEPDLYPFEHRYVQLDNGIVHYVDEGSGPIILFLHASPMWSFTYRNFIIGLRNSFRCIAIDFPGWGFSPAPSFTFSLYDHSAVVRQFVQRLDLHDVTLMVQLTAGPIGLHAAGTIPSEFRALILADTFAWPLGGYPAAKRIFRFFSSPIFRFLVERTDIIPRVVSTLAPRGRKLSAGERAPYYRAFGDRISRGRIVDVLAQIYRTPNFLKEAEQALETLRPLPTLLMYGELSPVRLVGFQKRFEELFPRHRSIVIKGEGPVSYEGAPDVMISAIRGFMNDMVSVGSQPQSVA